MRLPLLAAAVPAAPPAESQRTPGGLAGDAAAARRWRGVGIGAVLLLIVAAGLVLRLIHNGYGLPYVYYFDEANHFTNHAVQMMSGNLDPGYYQNPSAFTYLIVLAFHLVFGVFGGHLAHASVLRQFVIDPTPLYEVGRTLAALLAMAGVVATFLVARRFFGAAVGLVAAAILTFAFLPFTYSRIAVTDVGTFVPVVVALYAALRVHEDNRAVHYLLGGAAVGAACGFKYTAGLAIIPLVVAAAIRFWPERSTRPLTRRRELRGLVLAAAALVACFAITTPYFFVHLHIALYQLKTQAQAAGGSEKLGQAQQGGFSYYLSSLTWGFGWGAAAFALVGAVVEVRRDRRRAAILLVFPLVLFLYMGVQTRYFGRWLLSIYPLLSILAGVGVVSLARLVAGVRLPRARLLALAAGILVTAAILVQPVAADIRTTAVLGRTDTRQLARDYLVAHFPRSLRAVIEPAVPDNFYLLRTSHPGRVHQFVRGFVKDIRRGSLADAPLGADTTYAASLRPEDIDAYRRAGYCVVVTMSLIRGRVDNPTQPRQYAYYNRLVRESTLLYTVSPFKPGRRPVPLHFDFSYDYYPTAYERPGAIVDVYRLHDCTEQYGAVPTRPFGDTGLDKGLKSSFVPGQ